jgi:hypothetical protein
MPYTNVDIFREKGAVLKVFQKKFREPLIFMKKMGQKKIIDVFCCHLTQT